MSFSSHFDPKNPYQSIVDFTNSGVLLLKEQKKQFICSAEKFFVKMAYNDKRCSTSNPSQIALYDAPNLVNVMNKLGLEEKEVRFNQLLANVSKVADVSLRDYNKSFPLEVIIYDEENMKDIVFWGWIEARYLNDSKKVENFRKEGKLIFKTKEIEPSTLLALQRFQSFLSKKNESNINVDLSFEMLLDLVLFSYEWEIKPLQNELRDFFQKMNLDKRSPEEKAEFALAQEQYDAEKLKKALQEVQTNSETSSSSSITFSYYEEGIDESQWFNKQDPYGSIIRFTGRCCTLSKSEQLKFFSAIRFFFTGAYCEQKTVEIPKSLEKKFALVALPFLLKTMQHMADERKRFLATIMLVTKKSFPCLSPRDQVRITGTPYGENQVRMGWVVEEKKSFELECTTPLEIIKLVEEKSLDINLLEDASSKEVVSSFFYALQLKVSDKRKDIGEIIKKRLLNDDSAAEISTVLTKHLDRQEVKALIFEADYRCFMPHVKELSQDELMGLFLFFLENRIGSLTDIIKTCLEPTGHLFPVLNKLVEKFTGFQKNEESDYSYEVRGYCKDRLLSLIPNNGQTQWTLYGTGVPKILFVKEMFTKFQYVKYEKKEERINEIKEKKNTLKMTSEDFKELYEFLSGNEATQLAKIAGVEKECNWLVDGMIEVQPELLTETYVESFIQTFFPDHQGKKDSPFVKAINAMMELCIKRDFYYESKRIELVQKHPLSNEEIIAIHEAILSEEGSKWLQNKKKCQSYEFKETFSAYHFKKIVLEDSLEKILGKMTLENSSPPEIGLTFLKSLAVEDDSSAVVEKAMSNVSTREESVKILELLKNKEIQVAFEKYFKDRYELSLEFMENFEIAEAFANDFFKEFNLTLREDFENKRENFVKILKRILASVYRHKKEIRFKTLWACANDTLLDYELSVEAYRLFNNNQVKEWVNKQAGDFMAQALLTSFAESYRLEALLEIRDFIDTIQKRKMLENSSALKCLEYILKNILSSSLEFLKEDSTWFKQRIQTSVNDYKVSLDDIETIKKVLNNTELTSKMTKENFQEKIGLLQKAISEVTIEKPKVTIEKPKSESENNKDGCLIS